MMASDVTRGDRASGARRLAGILTRLDLHRRHQEHQAELGVADLRILWMFTDRKPRTLADIASALRLEQSTVNRQVNAAFADGLLTRERSSAGAAYEFSPTSEGLAAFERDVTASLGAYESALAALGDAEASQFLDLMQRFLDEYGAVVASTGASACHDRGSQ
ncbi:MarR family winged helix-turn-helix transcriptional regulator [Paramicrobacterium chengjingii]|uniref:Winged helix-turn-helix transcriptional regulator n=1 Tax=Paramicrobacterium chengjingii TaxID=2769067 RepID=A0ABX6YJT4_9MICO|nr:MarR family winged helix-turn-helix transcriptional regulator [Microbacterium chengjingii]QPZ38612.1 winged helix-turn-helix transcriptional regulator [Microbacterium chengjingii]